MKAVFHLNRLALSCATLALVAALAVAGWDCDALYPSSMQGFSTPLILAAKDNDLQCVKYFLKNGDDPNLGDKNGGKPLHYAAARGAGAIVQVLLDYGADGNVVQSLYGTPLMVASCLGQTNEITVLLRAGVDKNLTNSQGKNAVDAACVCPDAGPDCPKDHVLELLDTPEIRIPCEDIYSDDVQGFGRRLQYAVRDENLYCVQQFLEAGDNPNSHDRNGVNALIDAARTTSTEILQTILAFGSYGNRQDVLKYSALMWASCRGTDNNVDVLVDAGVEIGFEDSDGHTAADLACTCISSPDCLQEKMVDKIGEIQLYTYFNVDFKSDDGIINDGSVTLTETNRDCNEECQKTDGCMSWTRIKKETDYNQPGECWLRNWNPEGVKCFKCDSGRRQG